MGEAVPPGRCRQSLALGPGRRDKARADARARPATGALPRAEPGPGSEAEPEARPSKKPEKKNVLRDDQRLLAAKNESMRSSDGRYRFVMQSDSNLVLYGPSGRPLWASNTVGRGAHHLRMQGDGNLVIYNAKDKPIWASNTPRHYNAAWSCRTTAMS